MFVNTIHHFPKHFTCRSFLTAYNIRSKNVRFHVLFPRLFCGLPCWLTITDMLSSVSNTAHVCLTSYFPDCSVACLVGSQSQPCCLLFQPLPTCVSPAISQTVLWLALLAHNHSHVVFCFNHYPRVFHQLFLRLFCGLPCWLTITAMLSSVSTTAHVCFTSYFSDCSVACLVGSQSQTCCLLFQTLPTCV